MANPVLPAVVKVLTFVFPVLTTSCVFAQEKWIQNLEIFAGIGTIKNAGAGSTFELAKSSYLIGVGTSHSFSELFELNVRIASEQKGFKINEAIYNPYTNQNETIEIDRNIYCITAFAVPTFGIGSKKKLKIGIGPYFSVPYHIREYRTDRDASGNIVSQSSSGGSRVPNDVKNDFGLHLSIGYFVPFNDRNAFMIQITNSYGLIYYTNAFGRDLLNNVSTIVLSYRLKGKVRL